MYWSEGIDHLKAEHAIIVIHGSKRDADNYFLVVNSALHAHLDAHAPQVSKNTIIAAPRFYGKNVNAGQYGKNVLAWGKINTWVAGATSTHPTGSKISSYEAVKQLLLHFDDKKLYPKLRNITLVGHSAGAQLVSRFLALLPQEQQPKTYTRFVVGDQSSYPYFTPDRPKLAPKFVSKDSCNLYNEWRYGFENFSLEDFAGGPTNPQLFYQNYALRDVVHVSGLLDVVQNGDQSCSALMQGGHTRVQRGLIWWNYVNRLGRTDNNVSAYPGIFENLPDWSMYLNGTFAPRHIVVKDLGHDVEILASSEGSTAIFSQEVARGWRPEDNPNLFPANTIISGAYFQIRVPTVFCLYCTVLVLTGLFLIW